MIYGIGTDLVDLERIKHWLDEKHVTRILSIDEVEVIHSMTSIERKLTFIGGRFAAKEAIFKAISHGDGKTNFKDITILNDLHGKPYVKTHPFGQELQFQVSISHTEKQAIAFVICERL